MSKSPISVEGQSFWETATAPDDIVNRNTGDVFLAGVVSGTWTDNGVPNPDSKIRVLTQAEYDALTPDDDTLYFIVA